MMSRILHCNINVTDLQKSVAFYEKALGLRIKSRRPADDGSFELVFMEDGQSDFALELTWLRDHPQAYALGDNESHIAFGVDDYAAARALHDEMGCVCFVNEKMGLYFIEDPDGYWLEVLPLSRG